MALVLGFVGPIASGKDAAVDYIKQKTQAEVFGFSDVLKEILALMYLTPDRDHLTKLSEIVRDAFGDDVLAKTILAKVNDAKSAVVGVEGIRRWADIETLSQNPNFHLISIEVDPKIRYERITKRTEKPDDKGKTWEEFLADNQKSTELAIQDVAAKAEFHVDNGGTMENLYKQLDEILEKLQG
jgi:dephospho-CoA kinase